MPRPSGNTGTPTYRLHKATGQAVVTIEGHDFYLGQYDSARSKAEYDRRIGEWLTHGRNLPPQSDVALIEIIQAFWKYVQAYYANPDGSNGEIESYRIALAKVNYLYGETDARDFGPRALKTVRDAMVQAGWCRTYINSQIGRVRRMFKWAAEQEVVDAEIWHRLQAVGGLRLGKSDARESEPVRPVPEALVEAVFVHVAPQVRAMIELQSVTGMRPGEVCSIRGCDLDTTGALWAFKPAHHKTKSRGHDRTIYLGSRARKIIEPFLNADLQAYLFSPAEAEAWHRAQRRCKRKTPLSCGNRAGTNCVKNPRRRPRARYSVISYGAAIKRGCQFAFPPPDELARQRVTARKGTRWETDKEWSVRLGPQNWEKLLKWRVEHSWHPHQLRHNAATRLRREYGLEAAQVILGHKTLTVTQVYAAKNVEAAQKIMMEVG